MNEVNSNRPSRIGLDGVTDIAIMKKLWKRIRRDLRAPRVLNFYLAADPLEWLPFEYRLDQEVEALRNDLSAGIFRAGAAEVIRGAKSLGLTRPLTFLTPIDALLYRSIVSRAEVDLVQSAPEWSRFGRSDAKQAHEDNEPESGWFRAWLARTGQLWAMTEKYEWLVETDISNFFPSVHLDAAFDHILANSRLDSSVIRVLGHMLHEFSPQEDYRVSPVGGLPQESFDSSRIIAHSFLQPVDEEFCEEGKEHRYSRYMDDIVIGVNSQLEGFRAVARAQRSLEKVGLYPNRSKTRIIPRSAFARDYMKEENDYLGTVDSRIKSGEALDLAEFVQRMRSHFTLKTRPQAWERVLRRYYTGARQLRVPIPINRIESHIRDYPASTANILDYLSTFRLTDARVRHVRSAIEEKGSLYEDVQLLAMQYAAISPTTRDARMKATVCGWATKLVDECRDAQPRLAASALVLLGKFGGENEEDYLLGAFESSAPSGNIFRRQLALILFGLGRLEWSDLLRIAVESNDARIMVDFLTAIHEGENRAVNLMMDASAPRERKAPDMFLIPPRPMFLAPIALHAAGTAGYKRREKWRSSIAKAAGDRDRIGESWLGL